jgi:hypothetical protein
MKLCTAVQEGCGYKDTLRACRYFAPLAKYFTVCITYQPALVVACFSVISSIAFGIFTFIKVNHYVRCEASGATKLTEI